MMQTPTATLQLQVGMTYNTRGGGSRVVHITDVIYGNQATPPVPDEYRGWMEILGRGQAPATCPKPGGWESAWAADGTSSCNPAYDAVSIYTGSMTRYWFNVVGRLYIQTSQHVGYNAVGRMGFQILYTTRSVVMGRMCMDVEHLNSSWATGRMNFVEG